MLANARSAEGRIVVGFDEHCGVCQRFAQMVQRLDWRHVIVADRAHSPRDERLWAVPVERRLREMVAIDRVSGQAVGGFDAVRVVLGSLPVLIPLRPFLAIAAKTGLGEAVYRRIAGGRWRERCARGTCSL